MKYYMNGTYAQAKAVLLQRVLPRTAQRSTLRSYCTTQVSTLGTYLGQQQSTRTKVSLANFTNAGAPQALSWCWANILRTHVVN